MLKNVIMIEMFVSVDIDNYHDKCQINISLRFKADFCQTAELLTNLR